MKISKLFIGSLLAILIGFGGMYELKTDAVYAYSVSGDTKTFTLQKAKT